MLHVRPTPSTSRGESLIPGKNERRGDRYVCLLLPLATSVGEGEIGGRQQRIHGGTIRGKATDADAGGGLRAAFRKSEQAGLADRSTQIAHTGFSDFRCQTGKEYSELIASETGEQITLAHSETEAISHLAQHAIRVHHPDGLIDLAKRIEIADNEDAG